MNEEKVVEAHSVERFQPCLFLSERFTGWIAYLSSFPVVIGSWDVKRRVAVLSAATFWSWRDPHQIVTLRLRSFQTLGYLGIVWG